MKNITQSGRSVPFSDLNLADLVDGVAPISSPATPYVTYMGSLTVPRCNEVVQWISFIKPLQISSRQLEVFR